MNNKGVQVDPKLVFAFTVNARNYSLIMKALRKFGGEGDKLASELESRRAKAWKEIVEKFQTFIHHSEQGDSE